VPLILPSQKEEEEEALLLFLVATSLAGANRHGAWW
jgi:hypothetical protein